MLNKYEWQIQWFLSGNIMEIVNRDVLFEYHWAVVPFYEQLDQLEVCLPVF